MNAVLVKPYITEKSISNVQNGKFTFIVAIEAGKNEIRKAVEDQFKVHVVAISTVTTKGKTKRVGTRRQIVAQQPIKKAIVHLAKGEKIDLFDLSSAKSK